MNLVLINKTQNHDFKKSLIKSLSKKFEKVFTEIKNEISNENKTLNVLNKKFNFNFKTKDLQKFKKFKIIAIIGMGGSILGAEALYNFLDNKIKKKVYFFNNINENKIKNFKQKYNLSKILFIIISKSGNTIETLSNTYALKILKKNSKNIILISEKKNNALFSLSKKLNLFYIEHKQYVGGRFSVLSEVGIIPAYLMEVNVPKLRSKILESLKIKKKNFLKKNTIKLVQLINSKKFNNLIFLNYVPNLEKFLFWCQQLIAESLGKKNKGFLPMISNTPKDHHSLLQLYLDGPKDKIFYIFSYDKQSKEKIKLIKNTNFINFLNNKDLNTIKKAQKNALIKSFKKKKVPFREFKLKNFSEETLGELFSYFIFETVVIGKMLNINPFDQPAVERVKIDTKKMLS
jgi:glucose-6-phosphate isomerase